MSSFNSTLQYAYDSYGVPAITTSAAVAAYCYQSVTSNLNAFYITAIDAYSAFMSSPDVQKNVKITTELAQKHLNASAIAKNIENSTLNKIAPIRTEEQIHLELKELKKKAFINQVLKENNEKRLKEFEAKLDVLVAEQIKLAQKENEGGKLNKMTRQGLENKKKQLIKEAEKLALEIEELQRQLDMFKTGAETNQIKKNHVVVKQRVQQATNVMNLLPIHPVIKGVFALGGKAVVAQSAQRLPEKGQTKEEELKKAEKGALTTAGSWTLSQIFNHTIMPLIRHMKDISVDQFRERMGMK